MPIAAIPTSPIRIITEDACDTICTELRVSPKAQVAVKDGATLAVELFTLLECCDQEVEMEEAAAKLKLEEAQQVAARLHTEQKESAAMSEKAAARRLEQAQVTKTNPAKETNRKLQRPKREKKKFAAPTALENALWARASGAGFNLSCK